MHWTLTMRDRRTGWLDARFYYHFRELLAHSQFRYAIEHLISGWPCGTCGISGEIHYRSARKSRDRLHSVSQPTH